MKRLAILVFFSVLLLIIFGCSTNKNPVSTFLTKLESSSQLNSPGIFWWNINGFRLATILDHYDINHGNWFIEKNALFQTDPVSPPDHRAIYRYFEDDYFSMSADLTVTDDDGRNYAIGLIFRAKDLSNYYYFYLGNSGEIACAKVINGQWHLLASRYFEPLSIGQTTTIQIQVKPGEVSIFRDGQHKYTIPLDITEFDKGKVGFTCSWGASAKFENMEIQLYE